MMPRPSRAAIVAAELGVTVADLVAAFEAKEIWRAVDGQPYEVSSWGTVRRAGAETPLQAAPSGGRLIVCFCQGGQKQTHKVHQLVARNFIGGPPFDGAVVAHNDGKALANNRVGNLRYTTVADNHADIDRHGTRRNGSKVPAAKLAEADIPVIRERIANGERYSLICADYDVSKSALTLIKQNRSWRHVAAI